MRQVVLRFQYQLIRFASSDPWGLLSKARERARARALWRSPWTQPECIKWCLYFRFKDGDADASSTCKNSWIGFAFLILTDTVWSGGEFGGNHWIHFYHNCLRLRIRQGRCGLATSLRPTLWKSFCMLEILQCNEESFRFWSFQIQVLIIQLIFRWISWNEHKC